MPRRLKRVLALLLVLVLISAAFSMPVSAADIYFTVINDNEPRELDSSTMPVEIKGVVYIPYDVFNNNKELGTMALSTGDNAMIYNDDFWLTFYINKNMTEDHNGNKYEWKAILRNGKIFVPAYETCKFFGIEYKKITSSNVGIIIRIMKGYTLDNSVYANAAEGVMKQLLKKYMQSLETPGQPATPTPVITTPPEKRNVDVYIAIYGLEEADNILWQLNSKKFTACFFVSAQDIKKYPDLVRKILGTGHRIGFLIQEDLKSEYKLASEYLKSTASGKTIFTATTGKVTEDMRKAADEMGVLIWFDGDNIDFSADDSFISAELVYQLEASRARADLVFKSGDEAADGLYDILNELEGIDYNVKRFRETATTCLEYYG